MGSDVGDDEGRVEGTGVLLPDTYVGSKEGEKVGAFEGEAVGTGVDLPEM